MFVSRSLLDVKWRQCLCLLALVVPGFFLAACSGLSFGGSGSSPTPKATAPSTPSPSSSLQVELSQIHWCGKPVMIFRDEGAISSTLSSSTPGTGSTPTPVRTGTPSVAGTPKTVTNWAEVEPNLGFTVYLPQKLPQSACLVSAIGTLHDPILGGSFVITYLLADHSSISLSEAPLRTQSIEFQCSVNTGSNTGSGKSGATPNPSHVPMQLCSGARDTTNIVFSAQGDTSTLQEFFNALQPGVNWVPAS